MMPFGENDDVISVSTFGQDDELVETPPVFDEQTAGWVYDTSSNLSIPIDEAEGLYAATASELEVPKDNLVKRFGKQFYNSTIGNIVNNISTQSNVGRIGTVTKALGELREDFFRRAENDEPVTEDEIEYYATVREVSPDGKIHIRELDEREFSIYKKYRRGELNIVAPAGVKDKMREFIPKMEAAEQKQFEATDISFNVSEAEALDEKITDAAAGIAGFVTQIAVMKKVAPTMPEWMVWEQVNLANGGEPGQGAAMQLTLGGIGKAIPGPGFTPALARGSVVSALFGTTTYLGGGDTTDVLINMGIPFAFEGIGLTKQSWAKYKNKSDMIKTIKEKAPALKNRSDIEIERAISGLLTNQEALKQYIPKEKAAEVSAQVKDYMQKLRYDELLEKANAGDKKAVKELNDYIQGTNLPTYEDLMNQYYDGNAGAVEQIISGNYYGGASPKPELVIPKLKPGTKIKIPPRSTKPTIADIKTAAKQTYMKGFIANLTTIRGKADNIVAGAGNKKQQIQAMKKSLRQIEAHYEKIAGDIEKYRDLLPETSEVQKLLPEFSKAVNEFTDNPSKSGFDRIKEITDKIYEQSAVFERRLTTQEAQTIPDEPYKTPDQYRREKIIFAENEDTRPGSISKNDMKKARERGFITSAKEILPELKVEGQYIPRETDPLAIKARNLVYDNIDMAEKLVRSSMNDKAVATASELIKYYGEKGRAASTEAEANVYFEKAGLVANNVAVKLTEAGRTVQAASILGRLTPEGQVRFAAREIQRYNEKITDKRGGVFGLKKKIPELTKEQTKYILEEMDSISKMPEGKERNVRFFKLQRYISDLIPSSLYRKVVTVWKAGLLTGIKTHGVNVFSNATHLGLESFKDIPASGVDKIVSYFTGKRSVTPTIKGIGKGTLEGLKNSIEYIKTGYSERDIGTKLDYKGTNFGEGNTAKALQAYTEGIFRVLGAEDQPFYYAAKTRSLYEQAKVSAINNGLTDQAAQKHINYLMENPTEQMVKYATKDAETAVYINRTTLGDVARGIQKLPGGEIIVPFGRTPSAVAMQIVNYSPVGIAKTIIENAGKGRFDQRSFSHGLGRGLTGIAILAIGVELYKNNMITLDYPKTEKERKLWELEGRIPNAVKIDDTWRPIQTLGPAGNLLVVGGHFKRAFDENGSPTAAMSEALGGSAKSFTEQTFLKGVNQFVDSLADPERSATQVVGNTISSIIPVAASDIARATDEYERRAETIPQKILKRIPGVRRRLEPAINTLGQKRQPTANPIELLMDPTRPSHDISTPVVKELRRLWDQGWEVSPDLLGGKNGYDVLTQAENTALWELAGDITRQGLETLVVNPIYTEIPDERKAQAVSDIISRAQTAAKTQAVAEKLSTIEGDELAETIYEMRRQSLATEDILPIALSKRNTRKALKEQKE